ncbi:hypothetical protein AB0L05_27870 [Nonomuraea pusilla]|uniref:hypothetical protein n=1 Tax=Nonomuraea pusilla TaxID=46177 RepID=UPI00331F1BF1
MRACTHWHGDQGRHCGDPDARLYITGWRCEAHTPAALAGHPEPGDTAYCPPARCLCGGCPSWAPAAARAYASLADSWVTDARHIASGKRRASPQAQTAAKQTVAEQQERKQRLRRGA